jgi:RNA polymerase sigma-70 factor (ECF subfamily)
MKRFPGDPRGQVADLYRDVGPAVYRRCLRLLGNQATAEDATQDVFLKLLREADRLQDRTTLLPWVYRVASNHCLNLRRDAGEHGESPLGHDLQLLPGTYGDRPDAYPERQLARTVLARVDDQTRAIAVAVLVDGMDVAEVSGTLGISPRTVSKKLRRFIGDAREFLLAAGEGGPFTTKGRLETELG